MFINLCRSQFDHKPSGGTDETMVACGLDLGGSFDEN